MRRCCPTLGRAADGCWGARHESQPKKDLQRGCRAWSAACQQPPLPEHGPRLALNWGCDVTPTQCGNAGCWRGMLRSAGWAKLSKRRGDGVFSSLPALPVQRMLRTALAVRGWRGRQSACHGRIARAVGSGGSHGALSRQLGASGSQGGQRGVRGWQDKRGGLRDGSPALSSLWGRCKRMTQRQEPPSQGQGTECPPDGLSGGVFPRHFPYIAQGISAEPCYGLGEGAGSRSPLDTLRRWSSGWVQAGANRETPGRCCPGVRPPARGSLHPPVTGWCRGRWQGTRSVQTAGKPCPPRAAAPSRFPSGMGAGLQTVDKLLAFKLESDSLLLARGAGNCAQEQVRRDPTLTRRRRMKLAGSTPPSRQPGCFPSDAFSFSLLLLFFHEGSKIRGVWPRRQREEQRASQPTAESHPPSHSWEQEHVGP